MLSVPMLWLWEKLAVMDPLPVHTAQMLAKAVLIVKNQNAVYTGKETIWHTYDPVLDGYLRRRSKLLKLQSISTI